MKEEYVLLQSDIDNKNVRKFYTNKEDAESDLKLIQANHSVCSHKDSKMLVTLTQCPGIVCERCPFRHDSKNNGLFQKFIEELYEYPSLDELKRIGFKGSKI